MSSEIAIEIVRAAMSGDRQAQANVVRHYAWIARYVARRYRRYATGAIGEDDMRSAGYCGLIRALRGYDEQRGAFSVHATNWVKKYVENEINLRRRNARVASGISTHSIDAPLDAKTSICDLLRADCDVELDASRAETCEQVREMVRSANLTRQERDVIERRWLTDEPPTLRELEIVIGRKRERIRQIESGAFRKLRPRALQLLSAAR